MKNFTFAHTKHCGLHQCFYSRLEVVMEIATVTIAKVMHKIEKQVLSLIKETGNKDVIVSDMVN